jgi:hypothetical protein
VILDAIAPVYRQTHRDRGTQEQNKNEIKKEEVG